MMHLTMSHDVMSTLARNSNELPRNLCRVSYAVSPKNEGGVSWMLVCVFSHVFLRDSHTISNSGLKRPGNFRHLELLFTKFPTWEGFQKNLRRSNRTKQRFWGGEGKSPAIVLRKTGSPLRL